MAITKVTRSLLSTGIDDQSNATAITIDSSENVGIGTSSPAELLSLDSGALRIDAANGVGGVGSLVMKIVDKANPSYGWLTSLETSANGNLQIGRLVNGTRTDVVNLARGNGDVTVTTSLGTISTFYNGAGSNAGVGANPAGYLGITRGGTATPLFISHSSTGSGEYVSFAQNTSVRGTITTNGSSTAYNTTSDYRLKENVDYTFDATTRLKQLKPSRFNFIEDETNTLVDGFLAHEVSSIVPESVSGTKDATKTLSNVIFNSNSQVIAEDITEADWTAGKESGIYDANTTWSASHTQPVYQQIDQAKLVPLLVKTIQELEERITTLENA
tara:strand:- start:25 stop:1014 length:990 start_codon:yes stop_codon:yes gene_type:complete